MDHHTAIQWLVHWPLMGRLLHLVQWGGDWAGPNFAVPNVTAHPSTASVPTSHYSMWHYYCLWSLKGYNLQAGSCGANMHSPTCYLTVLNEILYTLKHCSSLMSILWMTFLSLMLCLSFKMYICIYWCILFVDLFNAFYQLCSTLTWLCIS